MKRRHFLKSAGVTGILGPIAPVLARSQQALSQTRPADPHVEGLDHPPVWGRKGVVASQDLQASMAGMQILRRGGNAIDAIVATSAALNVCEPNGSGMGGFGGFMMIYSARDKKVVALDMMGKSAQAASFDNMTEHDFDEGYKAPLVPGGIGGWAEALGRYGTMSLGDVFEPAIELAEDGFVVTRRDAATFAGAADKLRKFPTSAAIFMETGNTPVEGQLLKQKKLAASFRQIARDGADTFYRGEMADKIVRFLQEHGGILTKEDFARWQPRWREPIQIDFRGHTLHSMPPGSSSFATFQVLNVMESLDPHEVDCYTPEFAHQWIEAWKLAFIDDDRHNTGRDIDIPAARFISKEYAREQRRRISPTRAVPRELPALGAVGTTSLAAADAAGNMVAFTQSLVRAYGSGVAAADTGILLNNGHRYGFILDENHVNRLTPGSHAKGVMTPTIIMRGDQPLAGVGSSGGYTIPQTVGQTIAQMLMYGRDVQGAIAAPRIVLNSEAGPVPTGPDVQIYADPGYPEEVLQELRTIGHELTDPGSTGTVSGVYRDPSTGLLAGATDPRREGQAIAW